MGVPVTFGVLLSVGVLVTVGVRLSMGVPLSSGWFMPPGGVPLSPGGVWQAPQDGGEAVPTRGGGRGGGGGWKRSAGRARGSAA